MMYLRILLAALIFLSAGCTGVPLEKVRSEIYSGNLDRADLILGECKGVSKKDRLLCYMEGGISLYDIKAYKESADVFLKASRLIKEQDIVNISDQSAAVFINDRVMAYKGEYSERLWVHTFLMMNFLMQYDYENALIEAKQALELYDEYPDSLEDDYYTRALIALCFENMGLPDDARIEYDKLAEAMGGMGVSSEPVLQGKGELVLFIGQGRIPEKESIETVIPPSIRISIPQYADYYFPRPMTIRSDCRMDTPLQISTDLGDVAQTSLNDRAAQYLTRLTLRAGAKEAIARKLGEKNEFAEVIARAVLFISEEADTRSWKSLPESLTLIRIRLDPGIHALEISSENSETAYLGGLDIHEGEKLYRALRF